MTYIHGWMPLCGMQRFMCNVHPCILYKKNIPYGEEVVLTRQLRARSAVQECRSIMSFFSRHLVSMYNSPLYHSVLRYSHWPAYSDPAPHALLCNLSSLILYNAQCTFHGPQFRFVHGVLKCQGLPLQPARTSTGIKSSLILEL